MKTLQNTGPSSLQDSPRLAAGNLNNVVITRASCGLPRCLSEGCNQNGPTQKCARMLLSIKLKESLK